MPLSLKKGGNNQPPSASAKTQPVTFNPNPPQSTAAGALAAGKKQANAAKK